MSNLDNPSIYSGQRVLAKVNGQDRMLILGIEGASWAKKDVRLSPTGGWCMRFYPGLLTEEQIASLRPTPAGHLESDIECYYGDPNFFVVHGYDGSSTEVAADEWKHEGADLIFIRAGEVVARFPRATHGHFLEAYRPEYGQKGAYPLEEVDRLGVLA